MLYLGIFWLEFEEALGIVKFVKINKKNLFYFNKWNSLTTRLKKILIFWEMNFSRPKVKKFFYFLKKVFLIFQELEFFKKYYLYFRRWISEFKNYKEPILKKILICGEMELSSLKLKKLSIFHNTLPKPRK